MLAIKALNARATYLLKHLKDGRGDRKVGITLAEANHATSHVYKTWALLPSL